MKMYVCSVCFHTVLVVKVVLFDISYLQNTLIELCLFINIVVDIQTPEENYQ